MKARRFGNGDALETRKAKIQVAAIPRNDRIDQPRKCASRSTMMRGQKRIKNEPVA